MQKIGVYALTLGGRKKFGDAYDFGCETQRGCANWFASPSFGLQRPRASGVVANMSQNGEFAAKLQQV